MSSQIFNNNAKSQAAVISGTAGAALSVGGTSLTLTTGGGSKFPTPSGGNYFLVTLYEIDNTGKEFNYEVVKVTSVVGDTLTIARNFDPMAGVPGGGNAYPSGSGLNPSGVTYVELRYTAYAAANTLNKDDNLASVQSASTARMNLGLGSLATQNADSVNITGGTIGGVTLSAIDANTAFVDDVDNTKVMRFQLSGISSGTSRVLTVPDTSDTLVTLAASQTLTNKTLGATVLTGNLTSTGNPSANLGTGTLTAGAVSLSGNASVIGTVTAGAVNATSIGNVTPGTGAFTTLSASGNATVGGTLSVTGTLSFAGGINSTPIGGVTPSSGAFTSLSASGNASVGGTLSVTGDSTFSSTGALKVSSGTTAQRPAAAASAFRYNTSLSSFEGSDGTNWFSFITSQNAPPGMKNKLINGNFDVWQRGTTQTTTGYGSADRWKVDGISNATISQGAASAPYGKYYLLITPSSATNSLTIAQTLEDFNLRPLVGSQATFSFQANCGSGTQTVTAYIQKSTTANDSTGGGGGWSTIVSQAFSVTNTVQTFSITGLIPNDGTANGLRVAFSTSNTANGVGIGIWRAQLEAGSYVSTFDYRNIGIEDVLCKRYYQPIYGFSAGYVSAVSQTVGAQVSFLAMRATPASGTVNTNSSAGPIGSPAFAVVSNQYGYFSAVSTGVGGYLISASAALSAEL